ncbi:MAG: OmpA family protein, partial [Bacteroidota bacterium]
MKKIIALAVFALLLNPSFSFAQKNRVPSKCPKTQLKIGDKFYAESYFYTAAEYYKDVVRQDSSNRYANFWLAMSLLNARDYANSEVFFRQFYSIKPGPKTKKKKWDREDQVLFNKGGFYFGQVLHRNGKYDEAIEYLNKFTKSYVPKNDQDNLKKLAAIEIAGCEYAKSAPGAKVKAFTAGGNINKSYTEAAPVLINDNELYYTSFKIDALTTGDTLHHFVGPKSKRVYQIMRSNRAGNDWTKGTALDNKEINEEGYIVGNGTFNKDLNKFFFTKCLEMDDDRSLCNLFEADYSNGTFSNIKRLPEPINAKEEFTSTQPAVRTSDDGMEIIYFSSDRPGGVGGMDIWYFLRTQNGEFKGPMALKGPINTIGDELTPFFDDSTNTLYFSSTGHPGFGGLDVFKSTEGTDLAWSEVNNVGRPVSTGADDLYYTRNADQTQGYLVSNREGSVPLNGIVTASDDVFYWRNFNFAVQGIVFKEGAEGGGPLTGATFNLYRKEADGTKTLVAVDSMSTDGYYAFKMAPETDYEVQVIKDGYQLKSELVTTKGLPDEDTIQNNFNVRKERYVVKGLITEDGKTEGLMNASVTIIEVYPSGMEKTVYYMNSNPYYYFDVEGNKNYKIITRKEGYFSKTTDLNTAGIGNVDTITKDISIAKLEINKEYTLQNVLYEFGKATLTENSKSVLDNLLEILEENPSFIIELSAHTDHIGSDAANQKLSQARAESCVSYLASKGIAKDRLKAVGYGESKP